MVTIKESLTFDDVLLIPQYSSVLPSETKISLNLTKKIFLKVPFLSSAMDTVTESKMAIAMALAGGIGVIHRNLSIKDQVKEITKVKNRKLIVGAAVGTSKEDLERAKALINNGCDMIVVDTAHGHSAKVLKILTKLKKIEKNISLCVGNIATGEAAKRLYDSGADIIKVGIGPGSICTTRMVAGIGVPQISAILEVKQALKNKKIKIISDGGIKFSGDIAKALAAGADAIMMGSIFAGTDESPGKKFKVKGKYISNIGAWDLLVPCPLDQQTDIFKKILKINQNLFQRVWRVEWSIKEVFQKLFINYREVSALLWGILALKI